MTSPFKLPPEKQFFDLSLWSAPVAQAFVRAFYSRIYLRPEWFVLTALISGIALAFALFAEVHSRIVVLLIFFRCLFDVIDGMWARATGTVTPLGGLLDLSADIISNTLLFVSLGILFFRVRSFWSIPLTLSAYLIMHVTMTFYSMNLFFYQKGDKASISEFIEGNFQDIQTFPLIFLYRITWRPLAIAVSRLTTRIHLRFLSIFGLGSHLLYLAVCVLFLKPYYLIYVELGLAVIFIFFLLPGISKKSLP